MDRGGAHPPVAQPPVELDGEEDVRRLRTPVGGPRVVARALEPGSSMSRRRAVPPELRTTNRAGADRTSRGSSCSPAEVPSGWADWVRTRRRWCPGPSMTPAWRDQVDTWASASTPGEAAGTRGRPGRVPQSTTTVDPGVCQRPPLREVPDGQHETAPCPRAPGGLDAVPDEATVTTRSCGHVGALEHLSVVVSGPIGGRYGRRRASGTTSTPRRARRRRPAGRRERSRTRCGRRWATMSLGVGVLANRRVNDHGRGADAEDFRSARRRSGATEDQSARLVEADAGQEQPTRLADREELVLRLGLGVGARTFTCDDVGLVECTDGGNCGGTATAVASASGESRRERVRQAHDGRELGAESEERGCTRPVRAPRGGEFKPGTGCCR